MRAGTVLRVTSIASISLAGFLSAQEIPTRPDATIASKDDFAKPKSVIISLRSVVPESAVPLLRRELREELTRAGIVEVTGDRADAVVAISAQAVFVQANPASQKALAKSAVSPQMKLEMQAVDGYRVKFDGDFRVRGEQSSRWRESGTGQEMSLTADEAIRSTGRRIAREIRAVVQPGMASIERIYLWPDARDDLSRRFYKKFSSELSNAGFTVVADEQESDASFIALFSVFPDRAGFGIAYMYELKAKYTKTAGSASCGYGAENGVADADTAVDKIAAELVSDFRKEKAGEEVIPRIVGN